MEWKRLMWVSAAIIVGACGDDAQGGSGETPSQSGDGDAQHMQSGGKPASGACSTRHCNAEGIFTCFEWGVDDDEHRDLCEQFGGEVGEGACPDADRVAGCKSTSPFSNDGCVINWSYAPLVESDVRDDCTERKGELVH